MILVTGGTGLVGSHLLFKLTQKNEKVRAIHREGSNIEYVERIFSFYTKKPKSLFDKIEWFEADINDLPKLKIGFKGIKLVYHCAAFISFDSSNYKALRTINIQGTSNIVNLCIENKIKKLCYVSSVATMGYNNSVINEETYWQGSKNQSVYAISKYGAELEVWRGIQEGVSSVIVNPGIIIGPGFWNSGSGSLFKMIYKGHRHYTNGVTGFVNVYDVTCAMIKLMESKIKNQRYILVAENLCYKKLINLISKHLRVSHTNKLASKFMLNIALVFDYLVSKLLMKERRLTKELIRTIVRSNNYNSDKIINSLEEFKFNSIDESIKKVCEIFFMESSSVK